MRRAPFALFVVSLLLLTLGVVLAPGRAAADEPATDEPAAAIQAPSAAFQQLNKDLRSERNYMKRRALQKERAIAYLAQWKAAGTAAKDADTYWLGLFQQMAGQWKAAAASFAAASPNEAVSEGLRGAAAQAEARLLAGTEGREAVGMAATTASLKRLLAFAAAMGDPAQAAVRSSLEMSLAGALEGAGQKNEATALRMALVHRDPTTVARLYRTLIFGVLGSSHALADYPAILKQGTDLIALLSAQQGKAIELAEKKLATARTTLLETSPEALDEQGKLKNADRSKMSRLESLVWNADRAAARAKSLVERIAKADQPFKMLGKPVAAWTLEHAFGDVKAISDVEGKVVVMDFWATWCPWCIRSFPAIRDLTTKYGAKGLTFVGVTTSASRVYAARYDLDDDLKAKQAPGTRTKPAAQLANSRSPADGITYFTPEAYPAKEKEVIATFIKNHAMTWPVVMIDKTEPGPKYALGGWPHAVVLDRAGRVRYFKSGALLRDRKEAVEHFSKVLEDLLAEPVAKAGQ